MTCGEGGVHGWLLHHYSTTVTHLLLTRVCPFVYLEVLGAGEHLAAAWEGAREGLLPGVYSYVVHQLVLRLEAAAVARTTLPVTGVVGTLWAAHVFHCYVSHYLVHAGERFVARLLGVWLVRLYPHARQFLLDGLPHVPEEGSGGVRRGHGVHVVHVHTVVEL